MSAPAGTLRGVHWWAGEPHAGAGAGFTAIEATTGRELAPQFRDATAGEIDRAVAAAAAAEAQFAATPPELRARLLRAIADALLADSTLLLRAGAETALSEARLVSERARTVHQLRLYADLVEEGSWVDARIDRGDPQRQPQPKPDVRAMLVPLGPVAVFGASNFPLAYSVAGGDTASALAAGCPVVVKAHPAHPGTSEIVAGVVAAAVARCGAPAGTFGMLHGRSNDVGKSLVDDPRIAAVGFTGSAVGGKALCALAAARPVPIPVFAEMGSVNPVFVLPQALQQRGSEIAARIAASALQAVGQFCTSPGMVLFVDDGHGLFLDALRDHIGRAEIGTLVHPTIRSGYERALAEVDGLPGVEVSARGRGEAKCASTAAQPRLLSTTASRVLAQARLREEIFGPALLAVGCSSTDEMLAVARTLHGHLTATVHATGDDLRQHGELLAVLRRKVGRLIHDGVPTGVEVVAAMHHGGPWPASSDSRFTAVGQRAILRWVRPLCFQDAPPDALPAELRDGNPRKLWRTVDGVLGRH